MKEDIIPHDFTRNAVLYYTVEAKKPSEKHLNITKSEMLLVEIYNRLHKGLGYYLLLLALTTGLRFEELVGLTVDDLDFNKNTITVNKTWGYKKSMLEGFGPTKNKQSNRIIDVDEITMSKFEELFTTLANNPYELVFYSSASKYKVISNSNANKLLKNILVDLGIERITVHGLRHTHACVMLYKKVSIFTM